MARFPNTAIEQSIPARFAHAVAGRPERLAVGFGEIRLSYRELDRRSNRVANSLLAQRGPTPEPIALLLPQGADLISAILGVLKAGKFYLPLDPAWPTAHIETIIESAGAECTITEAGFGALASGTDPHDPTLPIPPDALAYIYYTSGSTGSPKGVCDCHRNVLHNIMRYTNALEITAADRLTLLQAPPFSGAVSSVFAALLNGAAVFPWDLRTEGMGKRLGAWLRRERITIYHSVPAIFRSFTTGDARFPDIRVVRLEGDAASRADVDLFQRHFEPHAILANGLGATETGLVAQFRHRASDPFTDGIVPIGWPLEDMYPRVLDENGREAPPATIGELVVRSRYLATGYWRQPDLTAAAFRTLENGEREYSTGDLARVRPDGCIEYLGRRNQWPKVRGHRVEPAEVERALYELEGVREAAVIVRDVGRGEGEVIAYLVPSAALPDERGLRERLAAKVPQHLVPARFILLDTLPLTENAKVDRWALAAMVPQPGNGGEPVAATDPLEARLIPIWERVLERSPIGVADDFFVLGGDSLRIAELLTALEDIGDHDLTPSIVVSAPTIRQLAEVLRHDGMLRPRALVPIQPGGTRHPIFMVHGHGGRVGHFVHLARALGPEQPFFALQSLGWTGRAPDTSIEAMADHYLEEVLRVQPSGPYHLGGYCYGGLVAMEMGQRLLARGEQVAFMFFVAASPDDFPGLVPDSVRWRFRLHNAWRRWDEGPTMGKIRHHVKAFREVALVRRLFYVLSVFRQMAGRIGTPAPEPARALRPVVSGANLDAQRGHRPRPWPGPIVMACRAAHTWLYSRDPSKEWGRVALGGARVGFLPVGPDMIITPEDARPVAAFLQAELQAKALPR